MSPPPSEPPGAANASRRRAGELVETVRRGDAGAREAALSALDELSRETGDPDIWQHYAYGLDAAGELDRAVELLEWLVESVPSDPWYQVHLARVRNARGERDLARRGLRAVLAGDPPEHIARLARIELAMLVVPGPVTVDAHREKDRQRTVLRAHIQRDQATVDDIMQLAILAGEQRRIDHDGEWLTEALDAVQSTLQAQPDHLGLIGHLALLRFLTGSPRAEETLLALARRAPDAPIVQLFESARATESGPAGDPARLTQLMQKVSKGDAGQREAALEALADGVARSPADAEQRTFYATALQIAGREPEALAQAKIGAELAGTDSAMHYNLGALFLRAGDRGRAEHHLRLAREYASNDEDRKDADELLARLRGS